MQLSKFQHHFKETILDAQNLDAADGTFKASFRQDHGISLENRMKVYRNNVIRSLTEAGLAAYKMSEQLVGRDFLEKAMTHYVTQNLPREGNLNLYAMEFAEFLRTYPPAKDLPYFADFAQVEAYWEQAYYACDDVALDLNKLAELSEDDTANLCFEFRDSIRFYESSYPLDEIIDYCRAEEREEHLQLSERGCKLMISRPQFQVEIRRLNDAEFLFLTEINKGKNLQQAAVTLSEIDPNNDIAPILQKHFELGTFKDFKIGK